MGIILLSSITPKTDVLELFSRSAVKKETGRESRNLEVWVMIWRSGILAAPLLQSLGTLGKLEDSFIHDSVSNIKQEEEVRRELQVSTDSGC
jgi:hypothetical protein